ncbi:MAG: hypothetical protein CMF23_03330 [Ignavibacteriae bacterium]|nr:hypothetical protein [Ignavibacteriota bacterium]
MAKLSLRISRYIKETYIAWLFIFLFFILIYIFLTINKFDTQQIKSNEKVIFYADNITPAHKTLIDKFNKTYEGQIKVVPIDLPFTKFTTNERKELLARSLRSKSDKIDLFSIDIIWGYRFAKWAENLDKYIEKDLLDKIISPTKMTCIYKDSLIAVPFVVDVGTLYYREDALKKLPNSDRIIEEINNSITWDRLLELQRKLKIEDRFYLFPADDYEGLVCTYYELILNQNRDFFNNSEIDFTRIEAKKALQLLYDLIYKYKSTTQKVTSFTEQPANEYFVKNDGLFLRSWPTFIKEYESNNNVSNLDEFFKKAPLPKFEETKPASVLGGWNLMIAKSSRNKKETAIFLKYLISEDSQRYLFEQNGSLPVHKDVYENIHLTKNSEELEYYQKAFEYSVHRPMLTDYTRISDIISFYVHEALNNKIGIEEALYLATKKIKSNEVLFK